MRSPHAQVRLTNLEVYTLCQTLCMRGMPWLPALTWSWAGYFYYNGRRCDNDHALALIAMHALYWLSTLHSDKPRIYKPTIGMLWYEHDDHMMFDFIGVKQNTDTMVWDGSTQGAVFIESVLQCVVNATTHLDTEAAKALERKALQTFAPNLLKKDEEE